MIGAPFPPRSQTYGRGLEDLEFGDSRICRIDGATGRLWYRGYPIEQLAEHALEVWEVRQQASSSNHAATLPTD